MTVGEIKRLVVEQFGQTDDEARPHMPKLTLYINDGYDIMVNAWKPRTHIGDEGFPRMMADDETPQLPIWLHAYLADYATYLIYRNGNAQRQQRGIPYLARFNEAVSRIRLEGDGEEPGYPGRFHNLGPWRGVPAALRDSNHDMEFLPF